MSKWLLVWAPRVLGIALTLFIAMFALDSFGEGKSIWRALGDFAIHLIPAFVMLAVVVASWRRPWIGGLVFIVLAVLYAMSVPSRPDWILVISGPLIVVGFLFLWSWWTSRVART
jgi:hypothetical protein